MFARSILRSRAPRPECFEVFRLPTTPARESRCSYRTQGRELGPEGSRFADQEAAPRFSGREKERPRVRGEYFRRVRNEVVRVFSGQRSQRRFSTCAFFVQVDGGCHVHGRPDRHDVHGHVQAELSKSSGELSFLICVGTLQKKRGSTSRLTWASGSGFWCRLRCAVSPTLEGSLTAGSCCAN